MAMTTLIDLTVRLSLVPVPGPIVRCHFCHAPTVRPWQIEICHGDTVIGGFPLCEGCRVRYTKIKLGFCEESNSILLRNGETR